MALKPGTNLAIASTRPPGVRTKSRAAYTRIRFQGDAADEPQHRATALAPQDVPQRVADRCGNQGGRHHDRKIHPPRPAKAPAASSTGAEGIGNPACSPSTQKNKTEYPW